MKLAIKALLIAGILLLGYALAETVMEPIRFRKERDRRYEKVIGRLKDIRTAQLAYKSARNKYADNFDKLLDFIRRDSFMVVFQKGDADDSIAVAMGQVVRDTFFVAVRDSVFPAGFPVDSLPYIPFSGGRKFELRAGEIEKGGVRVSVFEVVDAAPFDPFFVLRVGSMEETTTDGNWE